MLVHDNVDSDLTSSHIIFVELNCIVLGLQVLASVVSRVDGAEGGAGGGQQLRPVRRGIVQDWDMMESIYSYILYDQARGDIALLSCTKIAITPSPSRPPKPLALGPKAPTLPLPLLHLTPASWPCSSAGHRAARDPLSWRSRCSRRKRIERRLRRQGLCHVDP